MKYDPGIGATKELNLRVSVATLVRVLFKHPGDGEWMLALERKATLHGTQVDVKSQPFGGAIRILDVDAIHDLLGDFHFDSGHSRAEQDFRLFIRPSSWPMLREFCIQHLGLVDDPILEAEPARELIEEFADALEINLKPEQYVSKPVATLVEAEAAPTENIHAQGAPTARVYRVFEATILDAALIDAMLMNSASHSDQDLSELALNDARNGGRGRATAMLVLPLKRISAHYVTLSPDERNTPISFEQHRLCETIPAALAAIPVPKYQRL